MSIDVISIMESVGAILRDDHFVFTSGKHSDVYVDKATLFPHVEQTCEVGRMMAEKISHLDVETVVGPALAGIVLSQWVAYHLTKMKKKPIYSVFAEKDGKGGFLFKRGYDAYIRQKKVVVLEDTMATGSTTRKVVNLVRATEGQMQAVCAMVNRDPANINDKMFGAPLFTLADFVAKAYDEKDLPKEIRQRPINTTVGHGKEYLENKNNKKK